MKTTIRAIASFIALGIGGVSIAMTFSFGMLFAEGADAYIYAGLFGLLDAAKMLLPTLAGYLAFKGMKPAAWRARFCYIFFAILSASSHVGLTLTVKDTESAGAKSAQVRLSDAIAARDRIQGQIDRLGKLPSAGTIAAELAQIERDPIFTDAKRSAGCVNDTADDSRKLCDRWRAVKGQKTDRETLDRLDAELAAAQSKVDGLNTGGALKKANILASTLADKTGADEWTVLLVIAIIMALGIEAGSSLLLELAAAVGHQPQKETSLPDDVSRVTLEQLKFSRRRENSTEAEEPADAPSDSIIAAESRENATSSLPTSCPKAWVQSRMQPKRGAQILLDETLALYETEAAEAGMSPASANAFGRALTGNGYDRKRQGGKTMILAAEVRSTKAKSKLSVVK